MPIVLNHANPPIFETADTLDNISAAKIIRPDPFGADCVRLAVEYITAHYGEPLSVADLARHASVSHSSLYRGFLEQYGVPPKRFLMEYRIDRACELMETTGRPIGDIAAAVGFDDPFYFSRIFKQLRGMPPRQYAAAVRNAAGE